MTESTLHLALPKGRMQEGVLSLLKEAGIRVTNTSRSYRPSVSLEDCDTKILKPQNIIEMLHLGSRDVGFAGADWVDELGLSDGSIVELLDTELDPVRIVAAAPKELLDADGKLPEQRLVVASEYVRLTNQWIKNTGKDAICVRSYGATEVFPPEDADIIVDNTATGTTLRNNGLVIIDDLMRSSTRLFAHNKALENPAKRERIETMVLLLQSVLDARNRVMLEVNVGRDALDAVVDALPCMRKPTIATLFGEEGYAVKAAVPRRVLPTLIPLLKERGGSDIVVAKIAQIVV